MQNTEKHSMRAVSVLLYAPFVKARAMFDIATLISGSMSILLGYFDLITVTAERPASHNYDVANGARTWRASQLTSKNSARALTQTEMSELALYMLFKVRSEVRSINCSASRAGSKPLGGICIVNKRISYPIVLKYFS